MSAPTTGSEASPATLLRSLTDAVVTVRTHQGEATGTVLSCTRLSVWLICDDVDVVVALDDILDVEEHAHAEAA